MPNLPRLNCCEVLNERQYCFLSVDEIFFNYTEPFSAMQVFNIYRSCHISKSKSSMFLFSMFPRTPDAQTAAAEWLRGIKWKTILLSICWRNRFQFWRAVFRQCVWLNSCHLGMCWHDCTRIHPNIDVSKNAICPICRGWMAAGYQMKGNVAFYLLTKYFSIITSRFFAMKVLI